MNIIKSETKKNLRDYWKTPKWLTAMISSMYKVDFVLDPCCNRDNSHGSFYIDESMDGLKVDWLEFIESCISDEFYSFPVVWVNPPFSQLDKWIEKVIEESGKGLTIFLLHPDTPDTGWYQKIEARCKIQLVPTGRINFVDPETNIEKKGVGFPSCISIFNSLPGSNVQRVRLDLNLVGYHVE